MPGPTTDLNIEQPEALLLYLRERGHLAAGEPAECHVLAGGVSNRTVWLDRPQGEAWVIKQALPKLRVAEDWFSDPSRIEGEARALKWLPRLAPPGSITPLIFEDPEHHLLAMQAVPQPHQNWKTVLLAGELKPHHLIQFGQLLGTIHRRSAELGTQLAPLFEKREFFETLRLEPYYRFSAGRNPATAGFFEELITDTLAARLALVHGDYSPKNILLHDDRLILLDHEVIHWGDPAFDLGFSLTHLFSKARHVVSHRGDFLRATTLYWDSYCQAAGDLPGQPGFELRSVRHTLGCLLARVEGRSPLEYLSASARQQQRQAALDLIATPPQNIAALADYFSRTLNP